MKSFLLAAGYGTRLKPITDTKAKCLVDMKGEPLLAWWFKLFRENNIDEVFINTHYLSEQVEGFVYEYNEENSYKATTHFEAELLGSGGTVLKNKEFVEGEDSFFICYADNLTDISLRDMYAFHKKNHGILTMALFRTNKPNQCGIASLDENKKIVSFIEKPEKPESNLANAGIYVANQEVFDFFPDKEVIDFGKDVLPSLTGRMYGYEINNYLIDIGTMDNYLKAQKEWKYDYYKDTF